MSHKLDLLNGIAVFVEVVNNGSFTKTAERTGHSSSHISKQINKLEDRLGVRLLNRTTRVLSLSPEGEHYFQQCQQILHDAEQAENTISGKNTQPRGTLRISCPVSFGLSRLAPVLSKFSAAYPDIKLDLELNDQRIDMIAEGFDLLVRASATPLEDSNLISRPFFRSQGVVIASPEYLKQYGTPLHPKELAQHKTISYSNLKQPNTWNFIDQDNKRFSIKVDSHILSNSSQMEIALCTSGQGIAIMPSFNLNGEIERGELVELFADFPKPPIDIHLVYPSKKHLSPKVRSFIDFVVEAFEA